MHSWCSELMLTHWGRDKWTPFRRQLFQMHFLEWRCMYFEWIRFHWSLFLWVILTIIQHWFRWWLGTDQATSHYLNQWKVSQLMHICITQPQWIKDSRSSFDMFNLSCNISAIWPSLNPCTVINPILLIKSPQYTGGDFMFLYRFVRRRRCRRRRRRRPQILVHAITFEQLFGFLSFLAQLLALTYRLPD